MLEFFASKKEPESSFKECLVCHQSIIVPLLDVHMNEHFDKPEMDPTKLTGVVSGASDSREQLMRQKEFFSTFYQDSHMFDEERTAVAAIVGGSSRSAPPR